MALHDLPELQLTRPGKGLLIAESAARDLPRLILWATTEGSPHHADALGLLDLDVDAVEAFLVGDEQEWTIHGETPELRAAVIGALVELDLPLPLSPPQGECRFA